MSEPYVGLSPDASASNSIAIAVQRTPPPPSPPGTPMRQRLNSAQGFSVAVEPAAGDLPMSPSPAGGFTENRNDADIFVHVYYMRAVKFGGGESGGRVTAVQDFGLLQRAVQTVTGKYHVSVAVRGWEYVYGSYIASTRRFLGDPNVSGVVAHEPERAGPAFLFKQAVHVGRTNLSLEQIEALAMEMGQTEFNRRSYNMYYHNCADFAQEFSKRLGAESFPSWARFGADTVRMAEAGLNQIRNFMNVSNDEADDGASTQDGASALVEVGAGVAEAQTLPPQARFAAGVAEGQTLPQQAPLLPPQVAHVPATLPIVMPLAQVYSYPTAGPLMSAHALQVPAGFGHLQRL